MRTMRCRYPEAARSRFGELLLIHRKQRVITRCRALHLDRHDICTIPDDEIDFVRPHPHVPTDDVAATILEESSCDGLAPCTNLSWECATVHGRHAMPSK